MPKIDLSAETLEQAAALSTGFGMKSVTVGIERIIATFYQAYNAADLPDGWAFKDNLTLKDLETYFEAYEAEGDKGNAWGRSGRAIRAAAHAGWFTAPAGLTDETIGNLKPREATRIKNAVDAYYTRQTTTDPNLSAPSPDT